MVRWLFGLLLGVGLFLLLPVIQGILEVAHIAEPRPARMLADYGYPFSQPEAFALVTLALLSIAVLRAPARRRRREPPENRS